MWHVTERSRDETRSHGVPRRAESTAAALEELDGDPDDRASFLHACARYDAGDHESTVAHLTALLRKRPLHLGALKLLGYALYERQAYALAASPLITAAMLDSEDPEPAYVAACCLIKTRDLELARSVLQAVTEISRRIPLHAEFGLRARQLLATL